MEMLAPPWLAALGFVVTAATALFLGLTSLYFLRLGEELSRLELLCFAYGCGAALLSLAVFFTAAARLVYPWVFCVVFLAAAALFWRFGRRTVAQAVEGHRSETSVLFRVVAITYGLLYLVHGLAPEVASDATGYHLGLVGSYYRGHGFPGDVTSIYGALSQGTEMLYLFAYAFGGHSAAKLVHVSMLAATLAAMIAFGRRFKLGATGWAGAAIYLCSPVVGADAASAYNDCALAFFAFLTVYAAALWQERPAAGLLLVCGMLAGSCYAIKYTGFVAVPVALAWILPPKKRPTRIRRLAPFALGAALFILPWPAKNIATTGNPTAPFFNALFPNEVATPDWERRYTEGLRHFNGFGTENGWKDYLMAPWELAVDGRRLSGLLGVAFLLTPLALVDGRSSMTRKLLLTGLAFGLPWLANAGARFWIPALPFLALAMARGLAGLPRGSIVVAATVLLQAFSSWPEILERLRPGVWKLHDGAPWRVALGLEEAARYLRERVPGYDLALQIDRRSDGGRVFTFEQLPEAYMTTEAVVSFQSALGELLAQGLWSAQDEHFFPAQSLVVRMSDEPVSGVRAVQTEADSHGQWVISEVLLCKGPTPVRPRPSWTLSAPAQRWDAWRAFDGNPYSVWKAWTEVRAGMRFGVEFDEPIAITEAEFVYPLYGNWFSNLRFEARDERGNWLELNEVVQRFHEVDEAAFRRWAVAELGRNGITLLLTNVDGNGWNRLAKAIDEDPAAWDLREEYRLEGRRLYRIEQASELSR